MRLIIGLILFWLSITGITIFIEEKIKLDNRLSFPFTFILIGILEYIFGILNILKVGSLVLFLSSLIYLVFVFIKDKQIIKNYIKRIKKLSTIIVIFLFIYITIIGSISHILHYDNFSHWALIVKSMFKYDMLPNFEHSYIAFKGYQPGSACFIYYFGLLAGKTESCMIIGHNYLTFAFLSVLFNFISKDKKIIKNIFLVCFFIFINITSFIGFNNLLVDILISTISIYLYIIIYIYKDNLDKTFKYSIPVMIYLLLVKNIGLVMDGFFIIYLIIIGIKNKQYKVLIKYVVITGIILLFTLLTWQGHVKMAYGSSALESKHSLSIQNISSSIKELGPKKIKQFIKIYVTNIFTIKNNAPSIYMIIFNIIGLICMILSKSKKKVLKVLLSLDFVFFFYWLILGVLYIFSMPWFEAKVLACYDRYMMTIVFIVIGIFIFYLFNEEEIKYKSILMIFVSIILVVPGFFYKNFIQLLVGIDGYKESRVYEVDKIIDDIPKENTKYYIYSPISDNRNGFIRYVFKYKLSTDKVIVIDDTYDKSKIQDNSYIVLLEDRENAKICDDYKKINSIVCKK